MRRATEKKMHGRREVSLPIREPFKRVLVATDFSSGGERAVERAARLVSSGSVLTVLHVLAPIPKKTRKVGIADAARQELRRARAAAIQTVRAIGARSAKVRMKLARGNVAGEILHHTRSTKADLVVIGRSGGRRFKRLLLGSTAERVVRECGIPVLVVGRANPRPYRHPLVAVDFSKASKRALSLARALQHPEEHEVEVLHVYYVPFDHRIEIFLDSRDRSAHREAYRRPARAKLVRLLASTRDDEVQWKAVLRRGDPRRVILNYVEHHRTDLIAVGFGQQSSLARFLIGSTAIAVVRHSSCDVLVTPPDETRGQPAAT
jgi:nucleotide-binding universal stress UspA family protein